MRGAKGRLVAEEDRDQVGDGDRTDGQAQADLASAPGGESKNSKGKVVATAGLDGPALRPATPAL